jgi:prolactin regulatory element-binding protein
VKRLINSIALQKSTGSIDAKWSDDYPYQKLTSISPAGTAIAIGTTDNVVSVYAYPDLTGGQSLKMEHEVVDLHWGGDEGRTVSLLVPKRIPSEGPLHLEASLSASYWSQPQRR